MTAKRRTVPKHILKKLAEDGTLQNGLRAGVPRRRHCAGCGLAVLAMLDPVILGDVITLDALPVSAAGEAAALMDGCSSWYLRRNESDMRDAWEINHHPAATNIVLTTHRCDIRRDVCWPMVMKLYGAASKKQESTTGPPSF